MVTICFNGMRFYARKKDNTVSFCQDERFLVVKVVVSAVKKEDILNGGYPLFCWPG